MIRKLAVIAVVIVLGVGADLLAGAEPIGFGAAIGLVGTLLLTFGSRWLALLIKRPADYYDHEDLPRPSATEAADG